MTTGTAENETGKFLRLILLLSLVVAAIFVWRYSVKVQEGEACFAPDFQVFYHAALFLQGNAPLYTSDVGLLTKNNCVQGGYYPYVYPPHSVFLFWPLQFFSYEAARLIFLFFEVALWLAVLNAPSVRALWPRIAGAKNYRLVSFVLSLPALVNTLLTGQMGIFFAAVLLYGMANIGLRPTLAGMVLSLMAIKPTLALLLPFFFIAGKHFKALVVSGLCAGLLCLLSLLFWGLPLWLQWLESAHSIAAIFTWTELPANFITQMVSPFVGFRLLGFSPPVTSILQGMIALAAVASVSMAAYRRPARPETFALLFTSALVVSAYVWQYDAVIVTAVILLLVEHGYSRPLSATRRIVIIMAVFSGMVTIQLQLAGIPYGSLVLLLLWWQAMQLVKETGGFAGKSEKSH